MASHARPESRVYTQWVADNLNNPQVRLIEADVDTAAYDTGQIPGAIGWNWKTDLETQVTRDVADPQGVQRLLSEAGAAADTTIVLYGDNDSWFAAYALRLLEYHGIGNVKASERRPQDVAGREQAAHKRCAALRQDGL